jgi:hypothetical protein
VLVIRSPPPFVTVLLSNRQEFAREPRPELPLLEDEDWNEASGMVEGSARARESVEENKGSTLFWGGSNTILNEPSSRMEFANDRFNSSSACASVSPTLNSRGSSMCSRSISPSLPSEEEEACRCVESRKDSSRRECNDPSGIFEPPEAANGSLPDSPPPKELPDELKSTVVSCPCGTVNRTNLFEPDDDEVVETTEVPDAFDAEADVAVEVDELVEGPF